MHYRTNQKFGGPAQDLGGLMERTGLSSEFLRQPALFFYAQCNMSGDQTDSSDLDVAMTVEVR